MADTARFNSAPPIFVAIMCGGGGTRLWPVSRSAKPKQLQAMVTDRTMLAETADRLSGPEIDIAGMMLVTGEAFSGDAARAVAALGARAPLVIVEPSGRNTAPCAAAACFAALGEREDAVVALLPADHHIADAPAFRAAIADAALLAQQGYIVTLGVPPTAPETGFGYVKAGEKLGRGFKVDRFVEKPDKATAQAYLEDGGYFWNAGVFVTGARTFLNELKRFAPAMHDAVETAIGRGDVAPNAVSLDPDSWNACPSDSIDYAVAEKTDRAAVLPITVGWSDVGSWSAIWELLSKDSAGNVAIGDVMLEGTTNCLVRADSRLVATIGLKNIVVIETGDAVLIADKDSVQDIKKIVQRLTDESRAEARIPPAR